MQKRIEEGEGIVKMMIRSLLVALALLVLMPTPNTAVGQYYEPLRANGQEQRKNDPFVFCRYGMKKRLPAWRPLASYNGPWMPNSPPFCPYPNTGTCCFGWVCFRPWPQEDFDALFLYLRVCPQAGGGAKRWDGSGDPRQRDSDGYNDH